MYPTLPTQTQFVLDPDWSVWVIIYFWLGGIAAGAYFTAALVQLIGGDCHRGIIRTAHLIAFPLVAICGILLIVDLYRPERFWHMIIQSERYLPMFKWWSPMSVGAWALLIFGAFSFASFLNSLWELGIRLPFGNFMNALHHGWIGTIFNFLGSFFGFFIASYTGVLMDTSNQPIWSDQGFMGALFLASAASTGVAATYLLTPKRPENEEGLGELNGFDRWAMLLELALIIIFFIALGAALSTIVLTSIYGIILVFGVAVLGLIVPLLLHRFAGHNRWVMYLAPALVLAGGFLLRFVMVTMPHHI